MAQSKPVLGYWKTRCMAQHIRIILKYKEVDFIDKRYEQGPPPDFSRESWNSIKHTLGLDLPNLPYYIDGDINVTERLAIINYLARKYDLGGHAEKARVRNDTTLSWQSHFRWDWVAMVYKPEMEELKPDWLAKLPGNLKTLSDWLADNLYFAGEESPTVCDFCVYELLDQLKVFAPGCLGDLPRLSQFCDRIEALPTVKAYLESAEYLKWPYTSKIASWGGDRDGVMDGR